MLLYHTHYDMLLATYEPYAGCEGRQPCGGGWVCGPVGKTGFQAQSFEECQQHAVSEKADGFAISLVTNDCFMCTKAELQSLTPFPDYTVYKRTGTYTLIAI